MTIELFPRTREAVITYFNKTQDDEIKKLIPMKAKTVEEALEDYEKTLSSDSTSYGESIYVDGCHIGDIWCYCIGDEDPDAMLSFCIFEKNMWGQGIAKEVVRLFLIKAKEKFSLKTVGAFTYAHNISSVRVLLGSGFTEKETFIENGVESKYFQLDLI